MGSVCVCMCVYLRECASVCHCGRDVECRMSDDQAWDYGNKLQVKKSISMSHTSAESTHHNLNHRHRHTLSCTTTQKCVHTYMHTHTLTAFVCFGREGSVSLGSASTCSLLSWKKMNKYRANRTNHSSHALWHPFLYFKAHSHTHIRTHIPFI